MNALCREAYTVCCTNGRGDEEEEEGERSREETTDDDEDEDELPWRDRTAVDGPAKAASAAAW